mgnify:CR=1 FL=1|jgi:hypothetical protein
MPSQLERFRLRRSMTYLVARLPVEGEKVVQRSDFSSHASAEHTLWQFEAISDGLCSSGLEMIRVGPTVRRPPAVASSVPTPP